MKILYVYLILSMASLINMVVAQGNKEFQGIVISEDLNTVPTVSIFTKDTVFLGQTDHIGHFKVTLPTETTELLFWGQALGVEWTRIEIGGDCQRLEIIMMVEWIYDFISLDRINRKRYRRFRKLASIHKKAYKQNIFLTQKACVKYYFEAW